MWLQHMFMLTKQVPSDGGGGSTTSFPRLAASCRSRLASPHTARGPARPGRRPSCPDLPFRHELQEMRSISLLVLHGVPRAFRNLFAIYPRHLTCYQPDPSSRRLSHFSLDPYLLPLKSQFYYWVLLGSVRCSWDFFSVGGSVYWPDLVV